MRNLTAPQKSSSVELQSNSLYIGIVSSVVGSRVFVEVPQVAQGFSFGPCLVASDDVSITTTTSTTKSEGYVTDVETTVTRTRMIPQAGSRVLCSFLNGSIDELVVLGSILE